jgi:hypothetical protein
MRMLLALTCAVALTGCSKHPRIALPAPEIVARSAYILVVVEGNFEQETPTPAQLTSLRRMVQWLWKVPAARIQSHKDYARTDCPGVNLYRELAG